MHEGSSAVDGDGGHAGSSTGLGESMAAGEASAPRTNGSRRAPARRPHAAAALVLGALLVTSACGARWSDSERAAVYARAQGSAGAAGGTTGGQEATGTTLAGAAPGTDTPDGGAAASATGGTTGGSTGAAATTGGTAAGTTGGTSGPRPCAAPSTAPGVTPSTDHRRQHQHPLRPRPGPRRDLRRGRARLRRLPQRHRWRVRSPDRRSSRPTTATTNSQYRDARHRASTPRPSASPAASAGGDGGGVDVVKADNIPVVATATADSFQAAPTVFDINPPFANVPRRDRQVPATSTTTGVRTAALVYIDNAIVKTQVEQQQAQMEAVGIKIVNDQALPAQHAELRRRRPGRGQQQGRLPLLPGRREPERDDGPGDVRHRLQAEVRASTSPAYGSNFIQLAGPAAEGRDHLDPRPAQRGARGQRRADRPSSTGWPGSRPGSTAGHVRGRRVGGRQGVLRPPSNALPGPISRAALDRPAEVGRHLRRRRVLRARSSSGRSSATAASSACRSSAGKWKRVAPGSRVPLLSSRLLAAPRRGRGAGAPPPPARAARRRRRLRPHRGAPRRRPRRAVAAASPRSSGRTAPARRPPRRDERPPTPDPRLPPRRGPPPQPRGRRRRWPAWASATSARAGRCSRT